MSSSVLFICIASVLISICLADTITWVGPPNADPLWSNAALWDLKRLPTIHDDVILSTNTSDEFVVWIWRTNGTFQAYAKSITCVNGDMTVEVGNNGVLTMGSGGIQWSTGCTGNFEMSGGDVNCDGCETDWNFYGLPYTFWWAAGGIDIPVTINMWVPAYISSYYDEDDNVLPSSKYLNALIQVHDSPGEDPVPGVWFQNTATPNSATDGSGFAFGPDGMIMGTTSHSGIGKLYLSHGVNSTDPKIQGSAFVYIGYLYETDIEIAVPMTLSSFSSTEDVTTDDKVNISASVTVNSINMIATIGVFSNAWSTGQLTVTNTNSSDPVVFNVLQAINTSIIIAGEPTVDIRSFTCDGCTLDTSNGCSSATIQTLSYGTQANTAQYIVKCDVRVTDSSVLNAQSVSLTTDGSLSVNAMDVSNLGIYGGVINILAENQTVIGDCEFQSGGVYSNDGVANVHSFSLNHVGFNGEDRVISSIAWTTTYGWDQIYYFDLQNGATLTQG